MPKGDKLTARQQAFVGFYVDPNSDTVNNALQSALKAGYAYNTANNADRLILGRVGVKRACAETTAVLKAKSVKSRTERQAWWSEMMENGKTDADKLRASELLGRSEADFTDNIANTVEDQTKTLTPDQQIIELQSQIKLLQDSDAAGTAIAV